MVPLKATVENGRLVLDQPTSPPEGTIDAWDALDPESRRLLHEALEASEDDVEAGRVRSVHALLTELRSRRE